jgi:uncharacterized protein YhaN
MRIERLDILRYGALTDCSLSFRTDAKLHLVYGANEAGKSSALAALGDLLFGFPARKSFDFLHDAGALRVGARLRAADGTALEFRRRRGNKTTLRSHDEDEQPLRDDALVPFLGGLSRDMFERAFGLDSERLRQGAEEILRSQGDSSDALFAAASGLTGLTQLKTSLDSEAASLYAPRASKDRRFYQALERHREARERERGLELRGNDWKAVLGEIDELETRHATLTRKRAEARAEASRLMRLRQVRPVLRDIDTALAGLAGFADLEKLPAELAGDLAAAETGERQVANTLGELERRRAATADALSRLVRDDAVLHKEGRILDLVRQTGDFESKLADLPRIDAERDELDEKVVELLARLGLSRDSEPGLRQPTDAALAELRLLIAEGREAEAQLVTLNQRSSEERETLDRLQAQGEGAGLVDVRPWREQLDALTPDLQLLGRRGELLQVAQREQTRLTEAAARLGVSDIERLAGVALPTAEKLQEHRRIFEALATRRAGLESRLAAARGELEEISATLLREEAGAPLVSRAAIVEGRARRDDLFARLKPALAGAAALPDGAVVQAFEALSGDADRLADTALADAERVSRHAAASERKTRIAQVIADLAEALADESERTNDARARFAALFASTGVVVGTPSEMADWARAANEALSLRAELLQSETELARLDRLEAELRPALTRIAGAVRAEIAVDMPVLGVGRLVAERLAHLARVWTESRAAVGQREESARRLGRLSAEHDTALAAKADWTERFARASAAVGLDAKGTIAGATAALEAWGMLPARQAERDNRARRVVGMRRDGEAFVARVAALAGEVAPDLADHAPVDAVEALRRRLDVARSAATRHADLVESLRAIDAERSMLDADLVAARQRIAALVGELPAGADIGDLVRRLEERAVLAATLARSRAGLHEAGEADEAQLRADLAVYDPDSAAARGAELHEIESRLQGEVQEAYAALTTARRRREQMEAGAGAESAVFEKHAAEEELLEIAREWVRLRLASSVLGAAMEHHRTAHGDPMILRAGALLSTLSHGSLQRLVEDFDEEGRGHLRGVRRTGERIGVEAMSEGTRDQLFLALRLAFLEDYARNNEPAPFIGDDIFHTFDDARTASGLRTLAEASTSFQPILFTHHLSVVEAGRSALGDALDVIELPPAIAAG